MALLKSFYWGKGPNLPAASNTFLVGCRGRIRWDSVGRSVGWKVGPKSVGPLSYLRTGTLERSFLINPHKLHSLTNNDDITVRPVEKLFANAAETFLNLFTDRNTFIYN